MPGLEQPVAVRLDARGVPTVRAATLADAFRAQGFLHAQERFFQMDLSRRSAAGELAELFGERALRVDRARRVMQFRTRARALLDRLPASSLAYLNAYTEGVNAGLGDLGARPPEYLLLRQAPVAWRVEDSLLVFFALYTSLSNNDSYEKGQGVMRATLPPAVYEFLTPSTSRYDRPLTSRGSSDPTGGYRAARLPTPESIDLRAIEAPREAIVSPPLTGAASNQWAIGADRTESGHALVANDPHLGLGIPNTFYRVELEWADGVARGVSIPGVPGVLIGATENVAWGATVSNADQSDYVVIELDPGNPERYRTPDGMESITTRIETIHVAGRVEPEELRIEMTRWGPIVDEDWLGRPLALHATWLEPDGADLEILDLPLAKTSADAANRLRRWAGPSLNWVVADTQGSVAWTVNGPMPRRYGLDGSVPVSWADGNAGWDGRIEGPLTSAPSDGVLYTANNRTLDYSDSLALSRFWMRPLRAHRISELLDAGQKLSEAGSLQMQLDTLVEAFELFRSIALKVVAEDEPDPHLRAAREHIVEWNGRADTDQVGFRILQLYYNELLDAVLGPLLAPSIAADPDFVYRWPLADEPLRRIVEERPSHLLPANWSSWDEMLREELRDVLAAVDADPERPDSSAAWGDVNRLAVSHPLAGLPLIGRWLRLPSDEMPGSMASLRVAAPRYGAVIRMSVSPADPAAGILEMSAGQSGHFLSRNFADMQADWVNGTPTPFLAGPTVEAYMLVPGSPSSNR